MNIYLHLLEPTLNLLKNHMPELVSILALFLTIYQAILSREHNRLSVKPSLTTHISFDRPVNGLLIYTVKLSNCGLGPAIVTSYGIFDGSTIHYPFDPNDFAQLIFDHVGQVLNHGESKYFVLRKNAVIGSNETLTITEIAIDIQPNTDETELHAKLAKFHLIIEYESAYKEKLTYDSRNHIPPDKL